MLSRRVSLWKTTTTTTAAALFFLLFCGTRSSHHTAHALAAGRFSADAVGKKFGGGAGVGRLVIDEKADAWKCHYDMVLVERIQGKPKSDSGLYVPQDDLPRLHLCRVLSLGNGREEENGRIAPMPDIKVGDIVWAKNPWGIGPKDEETMDGKKLSYMRSQDIAAIITGGLAAEE